MTQANTYRYSSQTGGKTENAPDASQSQHNPEVRNEKGYPDTQDINTGSPQNPDSNNPSDTEQGSISMSQQETPTPTNGNPGFVNTTQDNKTQGGLTMTIWTSCNVLLFWMHF